MANPFAHIELNTDDVSAAKTFYKAVFGWKMKDADDYTMVDVGKGTGGGITKKPMPDAPTSWLPYVQVDDVKATLAKAAANGATVVVDYMSIGDMGAIGVFTDPTGATLGVWEMVKKPAKRKAPARAKSAKKKTAAKRRR